MNKDLIDHLDHALRHLVAARVDLGLEPDVEPPADALDHAFMVSGRAQDAREGPLRVLEALRRAEGRENRQGAFMAAEAAVNALVAATLDTGWAVGWTAGRAGSGPTRSSP